MTQMSLVDTLTWNTSIQDFLDCTKLVIVLPISSTLSHESICHLYLLLDQDWELKIVKASFVGGGHPD